MAVLIDPEESIEYILETDRKKEKKAQTVFFIKPMTGREFAKVATKIQKANDEPEVVYDVLKVAIKDWSNLKLSTGESLGFKTKNIDLLPMEIAGELLTQCLKMAGLDTEDAKN